MKDIIEDLKHSTLLKHFTILRHLSGVNVSKLAALGWFKHTDKSVYVEAFPALVTHWDTCRNVAGEYV